MCALTTTIRPEQTDDVAAIRRVHDAAFGGLTEGRIVDDLRGTDEWVPGGSLVAIDAEGQVVGHVLLSRGKVTREDGSVRAIGTIGPVGILPGRQREGIGSALMWRALDAARDVGLRAVCLVGHAGYYPRFGFVPARSLGLEPPHPWPDANWLALRLAARGPELGGVVSFPRAFPE